MYYDITGILLNPSAFRFCIDSLAEIFRNKTYDAIAAVEARGFFFAGPLALSLSIPVIPVRKKGKLPGITISKKYDLEYGQAEIEVHRNDIKEGTRILLMDDLIATGGTLNAARLLFEEAGASVPEFAGIVGLPFLDYDKILAPMPVTTLIQYHSE